MRSFFERSLAIEGSFETERKKTTSNHLEPNSSKSDLRLQWGLSDMIMGFPVQKSLAKIEL